ncbi:hypothetical protein BDV12DRAFT_197074 [Aspergillus spectabilis]
MAEDYQRIPSVVGSLDYTAITQTRLDGFKPRPGPHGLPNKVGQAWQFKRVMKITPFDWETEPYFLAILLALSQNQESALTAPARPSAFTGRLAVTHWKDVHHIYIYEANFTPELPNGLRNPKGAT